MLLDTNVISETWRARPDPRVMIWLNAADINELFICTPVVAEIRAGIEQLDDGPRRAYLENLADNLIDPMYRGRMLDFNLDAAFVFGRITAHRQKLGRRIEPVDGLIAAMALANRMPLVTRNTADFADIGLTIINPFDHGP